MAKRNKYKRKNDNDNQDKNRFDKMDDQPNRFEEYDKGEKIVKRKSKRKVKKEDDFWENNEYYTK